MNLTKASAVPLLLATLMAGCTALQPPRADSPTLYLLNAQPAGVAARPQRELALSIGTPRARPGFATPQMAYVRRPPRLDYYAKNRWVDTPARMLSPLLLQALAQAGGFRAVVPEASAVGTDLRLDTELIRLQQDFVAQPSRVQLALRAQLIDLKARKVIATKEFDAEETAPSEDAYGGAVAANRALARVLDEVVDFCSAASLRR